MPDSVEKIELLLGEILDRITVSDCPPGLAQATRYAVFPGGARIRPKLCLAVAQANGDSDSVLSGAGACAIELLHCASLVHDDLPCFDGALERRGKPSVHQAYGERLAVLAGDALIVTAFEALGIAAGSAAQPARLATLLVVLGRAAGMPLGISAGQAWECESEVDVSMYHQAKTGSLFVAATSAGAAAAGVDTAPWQTLGQCIGEGYQVADDIHDATAKQELSGKPVGMDAALGRPNAVLELGLDGAVAKLKSLLGEGIESIPQCPGRDELRALILQESKRFLPAKIARMAA
jgi:geranylgeranyl diphosphate synthase type II